MLGIKHNNFYSTMTDLESWYRIWEAAVAINKMCVQKGRWGKWRNLGKFSHTLVGYLQVKMYLPGPGKAHGLDIDLYKQRRFPSNPNGRR